MSAEEEKQPYRPGIDPISTKKEARAYIRQALKDNDLSKYESRVMRTFNFLAGPEGGFNVIMAIKMALVHHELSSRLPSTPPPNV